MVHDRVLLPEAWILLGEQLVYLPSLSSASKWHLEREHHQLLQRQRHRLQQRASAVRPEQRLQQEQGQGQARRAFHWWTRRL